MVFGGVGGDGVSGLLDGRGSDPFHGNGGGNRSLAAVLAETWAFRGDGVEGSLTVPITSITSLPTVGWQLGPYVDHQTHIAGRFMVSEVVGITTEIADETRTAVRSLDPTG